VQDNILKKKMFSQDIEIKEIQEKPENEAENQPTPKWKGNPGWKSPIEEIEEKEEREDKISTQSKERREKTDEK